MLCRETPSDTAKSEGYDDASESARRMRARVGSDTAWPNLASTGACVSVSMTLKYNERCIHSILYSRGSGPYLRAVDVLAGGSRGS